MPDPALPEHATDRPECRPCAGNSGYLDARTDGCHNQIDVAGDLRIHVSFRVSAPCTIATPKA